MASTQDTYSEAAKEHLETAQWLHEQGRYYLSHYYSGLAVECMLRAYLLKITKEFESRHDLYLLAKEAHFFDVVPQSLQKDYGTKFYELNRRWQSSHRYYSERQLTTFWNDRQIEFKVKGDRFKQISRVALNLALDIVNLGEAKWQTTN